MADPYRVVLSRRAAARLRRLQSHRRGRLTIRLIWLAAGEPDGGLLALRSWAHLAACEVLPEQRVILVYAILRRPELEAELLGEALTGELRDRYSARFMHGRR